MINLVGLFLLYSFCRLSVSYDWGKGTSCVPIVIHRQFLRSVLLLEITENIFLENKAMEKVHCLM